MQHGHAGMRSRREPYYGTRVVRECTYSSEPYRLKRSDCERANVRHRLGFIDLILGHTQSDVGRVTERHHVIGDTSYRQLLPKTRDFGRSCLIQHKADRIGHDGYAAVNLAMTSSSISKLE